MFRRHFWVVLPLLPAIASAQNDVLGKEAYERPPRHIEDAVTAPWFKNVSIGNVSPQGTHGIVSVRNGYGIPIQRMARAWDNLAGLQVDVQARRDRGIGTRGVDGFRIIRLNDGAYTAIPSPSGIPVSNAEWSPDGRKVAYMAHFDDRTELRVFDTVTGKDDVATRTPLQPVLVTSYSWTDNGEIVAVLRPDNAGSAPAKPLVAETPRVQTSDPESNRIRVYASLLQTPNEAARLNYFTTGQLAVIKPGGSVRKIGAPKRWRSVSADAKGKYFRVSTLEEPYSYLVPMSSFGSREFVIDDTGKELTELEKTPLRTGGATPPARNQDDQKRSLTWRADGAGLSFLQLGPADSNRRRKDRLMLWKAPFGEKDVEVVYETDTRMSSAQYGTDMKTLFITQTIEGKSRTSALRLSDKSKLYTVQESAAPAAPAAGRPGPPTPPAAGADDAEAQGRLLTRDGMVRIAADGKTVYFAGTIRPKEYMKEGPQPFLEKLDFETGKKERFFEGKKDKYETASLLNDDASAMLVNRESATEVGQTYFVSLPSKIEKQLTDNQVYNRDLVNAVREYITVTRNDGKTFRVKVTMMPGAFRRPAFFWFYPSEHRDQAAYDRGLSNVNINSFPSVSGANKAILLRAGYVYVEPDCPIFGERPNDSYVPQLRNNLSATIDALHEKGWVDRQKLAIGGHSYGGFSTLNAMIHTPFFKAGIAGASNTNRLLTPFGFQSESRMLWEGREMYLDMSPILHAEQLSGAVLLYHGAEDQNVGTALNNSERMFLALESLGKTSALYVYPYEDHGQVARETVLDQWARWIAWLDKYVK